MDKFEGFYRGKRTTKGEKNIATLLEALKELVGLVDAIREGEYTPDSFTTQPA
ncbi:unnamed protein product, partial [marine sediment metagenome]